MCAAIITPRFGASSSTHLPEDKRDTAKALSTSRSRVSAVKIPLHRARINCPTGEVMILTGGRAAGSSETYGCRRNVERPSRNRPVHRTHRALTRTGQLSKSNDRASCTKAIFMRAAVKRSFTFNTKTRLEAMRLQAVSSLLKRSRFQATADGDKRSRQQKEFAARPARRL